MWDYLEDCGWVRVQGAWYPPGADLRTANGYDSEEAEEIQLKRDRRRLAYALGYENVEQMMAAIGAKVK